MGTLEGTDGKGSGLGKKTKHFNEKFLCEAPTITRMSRL